MYVVFLFTIGCHGNEPVRAVVGLLNNVGRKSFPRFDARMLGWYRCVSGLIAFGLSVLFDCVLLYRNMRVYADASGVGICSFNVKKRK